MPNTFKWFAAIVLTVLLLAVIGELSFICSEIHDIHDQVDLMERALIDASILKPHIQNF